MAARSAVLMLGWLPRLLRIVPKLFGREERRGRPKPQNAKQIAALVIRPRAGGRQRGHRIRWRGLRLRMGMRMMAALARAGAVIAATRPRRAAPVVLAHMGVCALAVVAVAAMPAIVIDAALGADARPVVEIVATDQTVAAVELRAVIDRSHPARASFGTAARVVIDTDPMAAFLALAALPVAHVIGTVRAAWAIGVFVALAEIAMAVFAIPEIALALGIFTTERAVRSCLAFPTAEMVWWALRIDRAAFIVRDAIAIAAAPPLDAVVGADPLIAERATLAIVIVAAFLAGAASARCAAEQILAAVALGAGAVRNGAGVA